MFSQYDLQTRQMLTGNLLLVGCCVFYLAWWLIAFKPEGAIKGMKSGWLLIPAFLFGLAAVVQIVRGSSVDGQAALLPRTAVLVGGVAAYVVLLAATSIILNRQVTTELFLIVGWTVLMFLEVNGLFALGHYSRPTAITVLVITVLAAIVSLVCYLLYYNLDSVKGYVDGMIPLLLVAVMMIAVTVSVVCSK
ncbi:MAG: hypothetical protein LIO78_00780 [Clostridiales bacterium]|nr:hypothetical protein [Clostridiales bacterium]